MKFLLFILLATAIPAHALETDNYLAWGVNLPDASEDINSLIKSQIEDVISSANNNVSCQAITFRIANRFKTTPRRKLFEDWSTEHLTDKMFPSTPYYLEESIYRKTKRVYLSKSGLSPNLQSGGIYFGVDKLSHFGSTGRRYLKVFLNATKKGATKEEAEKKAIHKGLSNENGILGLWPSGVFSYGDLEANYQGFLFYRNLCLDEQDPYLKKVDGHWILSRIPDIRRYVNPYWDESFNLSYRAAGMWKVSSKIIKEEYCPLKYKKDVEKRFKLYHEIAKKSFSLNYIEELQNLNFRKAPDPLKKNQSVEKLCESSP